MLVLNTAQLRKEQNKLIKSFNGAKANVAELGIAGKDLEAVDEILSRHFDKRLTALIAEHRVLPEMLEKEEEKEAKQATAKSEASGNGVAAAPAAEDVDAF